LVIGYTWEGLPVYS